jgi:hypothetical protein
VQYTRNPSAPKLELDDVDLDPNSSRYIADQIKISNALALNVDEYMDSIRMQRMLLREKNIMTDDEEEFEDGVIDYVVPEVSDYTYHSKLLKKLNGIKQYYYDSFFRFFSSDSDKKEKIDVRPKDTPSITRKPTTDEKRFKRFINKRIRGFIDQELIEVVSFDHYISCASLFLSIFDKYSVTEHVSGLFDDEQTALYRLSIVENLLSLADSQEKKSRVLFLFVKVVLSNKFYGETDSRNTYTISGKTRSILFSFDNSESVLFREELEKMVETIAQNDVFCSVSSAIGCFDELYGYLTLKRINKYIEREFGGEIKWGVVNSDPTVAKIVVITSQISKYINYTDSLSINMLRDYNKYKKRWNKIVLEVRVDAKYINNKAPDPLVCIVREYDYSKKVCKVNMKRKSGKSDPEKRIPIW